MTAHYHGNRFDLPYLGFGLGLRPCHYHDILEQLPPVGWFEIISENYMDTGGRPIRMLEQVQEHYPLVMHGVSLSIGSTDPLNKTYLKQLKDLAGWVKPKWISDHLCWTGVAHTNSHDLLPVPYTQSALEVVVDRIKQVQDMLGQPILIENPSSYLTYKDSEMTEWDFIAHMAERADCGLLLDVNNVYVSSFNHQFAPERYIDAIPADRVVQIHLAGHENKGTHIIDTHSDHVIDEVLDLYRYTIQKIGKISTMVEWDDNLPDFKTVQSELQKAEAIVADIEQNNGFQAPEALTIGALPTYPTNMNRSYETILSTVQDAILTGEGESVFPDAWIEEKNGFAPKDQLQVYINQYRFRLFDVVDADYPATRYAVTDKVMDHLLRDYIEANPSTFYNIDKYTLGFADFIDQQQHIEGLSSEALAFVKALSYVEQQFAAVFPVEETAPLDKDSLSGISPEAFAAMSFTLRAASTLLVLTHPVNAFIVDFNKGEEPKLPTSEASWLLIFRHEDKVRRMPLEQAEYLLLEQLSLGKAVAEALDEVLSAGLVDDMYLLQHLQQWFAKWTGLGVFAQETVAMADSELELQEAS